MSRPLERPALAACVLLSAVACVPLLLAADSQEEVDLTVSHGHNEFTNSLGMKFVLVRPGKFPMGAPAGELSAQNEERPPHEAEITKAFYLGTCEVTQKQFETIMGSNPSEYRKGGTRATSVQGLDTSDFPVDAVTWEEAKGFADKLNALAAEKRFGVRYRLPTEAEWEYACRGGHKIRDFGKKAELPFCLDKPSPSLGFGDANFDANTPYGGGKKGQPLNRTCKVGSYPPNPIGLYDMHGNVWEWTADWYSATVYTDKNRRDPQGPNNGNGRVLRGGAWGNGAEACRSARRVGWSTRSAYVGFRVAATPAR